MVKFLDSQKNIFYTLIDFGSYVSYSSFIYA